MLKKYFATKVFKIWSEDFIDESTGEVVPVERRELLFDKGTLIDADVLVKLEFSMAADGIKEVEVTNQKRIAFERENTYIYPWIVQVEMDRKKHKFILYATGINNASEIIRDYLELNYSGGFSITMIKEHDSCIILADTLVEVSVNKELEDNDQGDSEQDISRKFFAIDTKIIYDDETETLQSFIVNAIDIDRSMLVISHYVNTKEAEYCAQQKKRNIKCTKREIHIGIDKAVPMPIGRFVPQEFSSAYYNN